MKKYLFSIAFILFSLSLYSQDVTETKPAEKTEKIYEENQLDTKPEYPSGKEAYLKFVSSNLHIPDIDKDIQEKVTIRFVIEIDGTATNFTIAENPGYGIGEEALRVIKKINLYWKPGLLKGKAVRSYHTETIKISIKS